MAEPKPIPRKRSAVQAVDHVTTGTTWDDLVPSTECVECMSVVLSAAELGVGVRSRQVHPGPRCENASDGATVKGSRVSGARSAGRRPDLDGRDADATILASPGGIAEIVLRGQRRRDLTGTPCHRLFDLTISRSLV
jgi:hypothetical protein